MTINLTKMIMTPLDNYSSNDEFLVRIGEEDQLSYHMDINKEHMDEWAYLVTALVLFCIGFFGFFLNLFVIALMYKDSQLWIPTNIILFNLVCSDFSVSILGNPFTLTSAIYHHWIFGGIMCELYGFFMSLLGITSITTLTVLAYERYCLIVSPFSSTHLSKTGAKITIIMIWAYSFFVTAPPLFGWGKYINEAANISCSVNWETQTYNATSYIIYLFVFGLVLPLLVITYSYVNIIITLRRNASRIGQVNRAEKKVTWMILVMIAAFLIAWTPYSIFALVEQFGDPELISPAMAVLPALIAKSSICYNPLIYVGTNSQFKAAWNRVWGKDQTATTIGESTINQVSSNSRMSVEWCTAFIRLNRRKRNKACLQAFKNLQRTVNDETRTSIFNNNNNDNDTDDYNDTQTIIENSNVENGSKKINNESRKISSESEDVHHMIISNSHADEKEKQIEKDKNKIRDVFQNERNLKSINSRKCKSDYELSVIKGGKTVLIRATSYRSNLD